MLNKVSSLLSAVPPHMYTVTIRTWHSTTETFLLAKCDILGFYEAHDNIMCVSERRKDEKSNRAVWNSPGR